MQLRFSTLLLALALGLAGQAAVAQAPQPPQPQFMFVQTAEGIRADAATLRLIGVAQQTVYFTDRPVRMAGHLPMAAYLEEWTTAAGRDNFTADPPNATLSVFEPGQATNQLAVIVISHPVVEGNDLIYRYRLLEGTMPRTGGQASLFIDWIGPGGGVGPGFHGVGRGARGVGLR
jgi:hypothetical protein